MRLNLQSIARPFVHALYPRGSIRTVLRGPIRGTRYVVADGMGATYALSHPAHAHDWFQSRLTRGAIAYDIGANRGAVALLFAQLVGEAGHVHSFEPVPAVADVFEQNVRLNSLHNVTLHRCALAAEDGRATFGFDPTASTTGHIGREAPQRFEVVTRALDNLIRDDLAPPALLKIDVEGGAEGVLRGARGTLLQHRPAVYIELHSRQEQEAVRDHLQAIGYQLWTMAGVEVHDPVAAWNSPLWCTKR